MAASVEGISLPGNLTDAVDSMSNSEINDTLRDGFQKNQMIWEKINQNLFDKKAEAVNQQKQQEILDQLRINYDFEKGQERTKLGKLREKITVSWERTLKSKWFEKTSEALKKMGNYLKSMSGGILGSLMGLAMMAALDPDGSLMSSIIDTIVDVLLMLFDMFVKLLPKMLNVITVAGPRIAKALISGFKKLFDAWIKAFGKADGFGKLILLALAFAVIIKIIMIVLPAIKILLTVITFLASPIGLIILAIAGIVAAFVWLYNNVAWFRDIVDGIIKGVKELFGAIWDYFSKTNSQQEALQKDLESGRITVEQAQKRYFEEDIKRKSELWSKVSKALKLDKLWEWIKGIGSKIGKWFGEVWDDLTKWFKGTIDSIGGWFSGIWTSIKTSFTNAIKKIKGIFSDLWNSIKRGWDAMKQMFSNIGTSIWEGIKSGLSSIGNFFYNIFQPPIRAIGEFFTKIVEKVKSILPDFMRGDKKMAEMMAMKTANTMDLSSAQRGGLKDVLTKQKFKADDSDQIEIIKSYARATAKKGASEAEIAAMTDNAQKLEELWNKLGEKIDKGLAATGKTDVVEQQAHLGKEMAEAFEAALKRGYTKEAARDIIIANPNNFKAELMKAPTAPR